MRDIHQEEMDNIINKYILMKIICLERSGEFMIKNKSIAEYVFKNLLN